MAAARHAGQVRRCSGVPYITHPVAVAWILDRLGFDEDVVIAGLLHDVVEDTPTPLIEIQDLFGAGVASLVDACSERKLDDAGGERPWLDRKREHIASLVDASSDARAIVLADKLHNLRSIRHDLDEGRPVWEAFHADRESVLRYYRDILSACDGGDGRLAGLAGQARGILLDLESR